MKNTFKAAIFALALTVTVGASAQGYMFNTNLKLGARGADVTALQSALVAGGYLSVTPTGYFGQLTKRAVQDFQRANGITPVSGFFGPLTRAVMNAGAPTTPTTPAACPIGYVCQPTSTGGSTSGSEGFAEVRVAVTPTNNPNVQFSTDVPVYGIEFRAKQSDITVERVNLQVSVTNAGSEENPSTLINTVIVKDGSTVLQTIPVSSATFSKVTTNGVTTYYLQVAGLGFRVAKDTAKDLTFSFNTNSIDTDRTVAVTVYGGATGQGIRVVDGRGISNYNGLGDVRTHTFKKPGTSTLTAKADATTLYANNYRVNVNGNGAEKVLSSTFAVKSETGSSKLNSVTVAVTASGTLPSNVYLYDGSTIVDARSGSTSVTFDLSNSNIVVSADTTKTFSVKVDMPSNTATGTVILTQVTAVSYEKPNGSSATISGLSIAGPYNYFAPIVAKFSKVSSSVSTVTNDGIDTAVVANFRLGIMADGGDLSTSTFAVIGIKNISTGVVIATSSVVGVPSESGLSLFADGATKYVDFSKTFASSSFSIGTTNTVRAFIESVAWKAATNGTFATSTRGFEALDSEGTASFSR
ncbi:MAG: peptidoglycan-binding domain-containing protein [Patescibacteria group bacterium]